VLPVPSSPDSSLDALAVLGCHTDPWLAALLLYVAPLLELASGSRVIRMPLANFLCIWRPPLAGCQTLTLAALFLYAEGDTLVKTVCRSTH
jgi:hypothetical protein